MNPADVLRAALAGDLATLGPRALRAMITTWDDPASGRPLQTVLRGAAADPALATVVRGGLQTELIDTLAARLGGADARIRAGLFASQVAGVIFSRYILGLEPMASLGVDEIVTRLGAARTHTHPPPPRAAARPPDGGVVGGHRRATAPPAR